MGDEGPGRGSAIERLQDRRFNLEKAQPVETPPDVPDGRCPHSEDIPYLGVHGEVGVPLTVADLGVLESAVTDRTVGPHLSFPARQRPERFGE